MFFNILHINDDGLLRSGHRYDVRGGMPSV
jgi:hypothetical protein